MWRSLIFYALLPFLETEEDAAEAANEASPWEAALIVFDAVGAVVALAAFCY